MSGTRGIGLQGVGTGGRLALAAMALFGLLFVVLALFVIRPSTSVPEGWVTGQGRVVDEKLNTSGSSTVAYPVVEYADPQGRTYRVTSSVGSSFRASIGDSMEVAFDPANPAMARVTGGTASMAWLAFAGFGAVFAALGGLLLLGTMPVAPGQMIADRVMAADVRRGPTGRDVFVRSRLRASVYLLVVLGGGVMVVLALAIGAPPGAAAFLLLVFVSLLLLAGRAAIRRRRIPVAEIGPDGIVVPDLGLLPWHAIADVRVERYPGTEAAATGYRRLGIVPRDPSLAEDRPVVERAMWGIVRPMLRTYAVAGIDVDEPAPFGIQEQELGRDGFERLMAAVERHRPINRDAPPLEPPALLAAVAPSLALPEPADGRDPIGRAADTLAATLEIAQLGLVIGVVGRILSMMIIAGGANAALPTVGGTVVVAVVVTTAVRIRRRGRGSAGVSRTGQVAALIVGCLIGIALPDVLRMFAG